MLQNLVENNRERSLRLIVVNGGLADGSRVCSSCGRIKPHDAFLDPWNNPRTDCDTCRVKRIATWQEIA